MRAGLSRSSEAPAGGPQLDRDSLIAGALIGLGLIVLAFATKGGVLSGLAGNTWSQIVLVVLGAATAVAVLLGGTPGRGWGRAALVAFAALSALTYASIAWSVAPASSWLEGNRTLSYLAAFAMAAGLARLAPRRWAAVTGALALYSFVVCSFALLTKVYPATFSPTYALGRVGAPFDYYNATGLAAALGLPAWLWVGAARGRRGESTPALARAATAASVPAIGVLVCTLILSYGRGALLAALIGLALWLAVVPARLKAVLVLGVGAAGGLAISLWATGQGALVHDYVPLAQRTSAGHRFGVALIIGAGALILAGVITSAAHRRIRLSGAARRRIGIALITLLALVPVAAMGALASSSRGFTGEISHLWSTLTNPQGGASDNPGRLAQLGSSRPRYWRDGIEVGEHAPWLGVGAGGFAIAHRRYTPNVVQQAHSYVVQTFADLGVMGLLVSATLFATWWLAVRQTLGGLRAGGSVQPRGSPEHGGDLLAEWDGLLTLLAVVVIFGVHSAIDWTWFVPGVAVPGLLGAGWLAGRGPLTQPVGRLAQVRSPMAQPGRGFAAFAVVVAALVAAWFVWQPLRSADASNAAISELSSGDAATALSDARTAVSADPVDPYARAVLAGIYEASGDLAAARAQLVDAVNSQPSNPDPWVQLADFDLAHGRSAEARRELARAHRLEPYERVLFAIPR